MGPMKACDMASARYWWKYKILWSHTQNSLEKGKYKPLNIWDNKSPNLGNSRLSQHLGIHHTTMPPFGCWHYPLSCWKKVNLSQCKINLGQILCWVAWKKVKGDLYSHHLIALNYMATKICENCNHTKTSSSDWNFWSLNQWWKLHHCQSND